MLALTGLLSACGGSSGSNANPVTPFTHIPQTSTTPASSSSLVDPDSQESDTSQASGSSDLTPIGTMTQTWTGATVATDYSVGKPTFGDASPLPDGVAGACQLTDPAVLASAAYFPLSMTVTFTGQVTTDVMVSPDGALQNEGTRLRLSGVRVAFTDDAGTSQWNCDNSPQTYSLGSGSHLNITAWVIVPDVITNQHPHPGIDVFNTWSLAPPATILMAGDPTNRSSGPHAAICHDGDQRLPVLSLFVTPPYHYAPADYTVNCVRA